MGTPTAYHKRKGNPWPDVATMLHACRSAVHHLPLPGISLVVSILSDLVGKVQAAKSNEQVAKDLGEDIRQLLEAIDTTAKKVQTDLDRFASASEDRSRMEQALRSASPLHGRIWSLRDELVILGTRANELRGKNLVSRWWYNKDDLQVLLSLREGVRKALSNFQVVNGIRIEKLVEDIAARVSRIETCMINIDKPKKTDEDERLLNMLPHVEAGFTAAVQEAKSHYVHLTCKRVLDDLQEWAHGNSSEEQFCKPIWILSGPAGSGKSTIAFKFAKQQQDLKVLGASFFFNAAEEELSSVRRLFSTIAYQLAYAQPCFRPGIVNAIRAHLTAGTNQQIECDAENLILSPLRSLPQQAHSILIVVDGLDECTDDNSKVAFPKVLRLLVALTQVPGSPFQILITTRQRDDIDQALSAPELQAVGYHVPLLDHLQSTGVDDARACLRDRISGLVYFQKNAPALRNLVSHVAPSIAYARVAIEFLVDDLDHLTEGLETLQSSNASPPSSALCGLYLTIIGRTYRIGATQWERMRKRAERPVVFALCGSRVCYQRITDWLFSGALTMPHSSIPPSLTFQLCPKCSAIVASRPVELWMLKRITASLAQAGIGNGAIFPTMSEYSASPRDPWLPDPPPISSSQASEADWGRTWSMSHDEVTHPLPDSPALSAPTTPSPRPHDILPTGNLKTVDHKFPASAPSSKRTIGISTIGIRRVASSASMLSPRPSPFEQPEPGADASADLSVSKARGDKTSGVQPSVPVQHPYIRARSASGPDRPQPVVLASGGRNESRSYANVSGLCLKPLPATPPVRPATRPQLPV